MNQLGYVNSHRVWLVILALVIGNSLSAQYVEKTSSYLAKAEYYAQLTNVDSTSHWLQKALDIGDQRLQISDTNTAIVIYEKVLNMAHTISFEREPYYRLYSSLLVDIYLDRNQYYNAIKWNKEVIRHYKLNDQGEELRCLRRFEEIGQLFQLLEQTDSTEFYFTQAVDSLPVILEDNTYEFVTRITNTLWDINHAQEDLHGLAKWSSFILSLNPPIDTVSGYYIQLSLYLAKVYETLSQDDSLITTLYKLMDIIKVTEGIESLTYYNTLVEVITIIDRQYFYVSSSMALRKQLVELTGNRIGMVTEDYGFVLALTARAFYDLGENDSALNYYARSLQVLDQVLDFKDQNYWKVQRDFALSHSSGEWNNALTILTEVHNFELNHYGDKSMYRLNSLALMGKRAYNQGDSKQAAEWLSEMVSLVQDLNVVNENLEYIKFAGAAYSSLGKYKKALFYFDLYKAHDQIHGWEYQQVNYAMFHTLVANNQTNEAIELSSELVTGSSMFDFATLLKLSNIYYNLGNVYQSHEFLKKALDNLDSGLTYGNHYYDLAMESLAHYILRYNNEVELAISVYTRIMEASISRSDSLVQLINIAAAYYFDEQYELSEKVLVEQIHPLEADANEYIQLLKAKLLMAQNHNDEALSLLKSLLIRYSSGEFSEIYMTDLAEINEKQGNYDQAIGYHTALNQRYHSKIVDVFSFSSEQQKKKFMELELFTRFTVQQSLNFKIKGLDTAFNQMNLNNVLIGKGLLLRSSKDIPEELRTLDSLPIQHELMYYARINNALTDYLLVGSNNKGIEDSLNKLKNASESKLVKWHSSLFPTASTADINWRDIKDALKENEVAIEFSRFNYKTSYGTTDSVIYVAYLIKKELNQPLFIPLCEESELKRLLHGTNPNQLYATRGVTLIDDEKQIYLSDSLYKYLWKSIEEHLTGVVTIYYSPDGVLHQVPLVAIKGKNGLVGRTYNLVLLSSTFRLVHELEEPQLEDVLIIGGIIYEYDTTGLISKGSSELSSSKPSISWDYLEGTENERIAIKTILKKGKISYNTWTKSYANEARFDSLNGHSPNILHISTHGFFFPKQFDSLGNKERTIYMQSQDPLTRSGLILSGGNYAWSSHSNPYAMEDGVLTAREISNMDLSNTKMVVLSACETGLGDIEGSEGVYGLQRAFKMAGVEIIVMSLWTVPDEETEEFMTSLYTLWMAGQDIRTAFANSQLNMAEKYKDDPVKWAGFVLYE